VPLTPEEQREYDNGFSIYRAYLQSRGIRIRSARDYQRFVMRSGRDPEARRALLARNRAMDLAMNSSAKLDYLKRIFQSYPDEKALVFTRHNKLVYRISREMLIPAITHQTPSREREQTLDRFKSGVYRRIVTSQVLDEGVDVPDASLAVVLSGTGSSRQFIQRLGRVLRKGEGKHARLVELVSKGTAETRVSRRRRGQ
jgi:superfamily II DNA or RNA helicase